MIFLFYISKKNVINVNFSLILVAYHFILIYNYLYFMKYNGVFLLNIVIVVYLESFCIRYYLYSSEI